MSPGKGRLRGLPLDELISESQIQEMFSGSDRPHKAPRTQPNPRHHVDELTMFRFLGLFILVVSITAVSIIPTLVFR